MTQQLHPDAPAIRMRLRQEGISALYHFTSVENLPGICQMQALCSKKILEEARDFPTATGGNLLSHSLDQQWGNWDKVCLSFTPHTPMAYHKKKEQHLCYFLISPEVATWQHTLFTDTNAASNGHQQKGGIAGLNLVQFATIKSIPFGVPGWHRGVQAEILVLDRIPFIDIAHIAFVSQASLDYAKQLCSTLVHPPFLLKPQIFTDAPKASPKAIQFPYIEDLFLIDPKYDEEKLQDMIYLSQIKRNEFSKKEECAIIFMQAPPETQIQITLTQMSTHTHTEPIVCSKNLSFYKRTRTQKINLNSLPLGKYSITCEIANVRWASTHFEIIL